MIGESAVNAMAGRVALHNSIAMQVQRMGSELGTVQHFLSCKKIMLLADASRNLQKRPLQCSCKAEGWWYLAHKS